MSTVSLTSEGQITIPNRVRQARGITPGSKVVVRRGRHQRTPQAGEKAVPFQRGGGFAILGYTGPRIRVDALHWRARHKEAN